MSNIVCMSAVQGKFPNSAYWFNQMYYGTNSAFRRSRAGRGLAFPSNVLSVRGFMEGNTYHSILNISVTPTRYCEKIQNSPSRGVSDVDSWRPFPFSLWIK